MAELYNQGHGSADGYHPAADTGSETGTSLRPVEENGQESRAEDAEPLTRDQYAEQVRQSEATAHDSTAGHDQDGTHDTAVSDDGQEREELPEPRTRQEVAEEAQSGADPLAHPSSDAQQHERHTGDWPSSGERARLHGTYLDWRNEMTSGPDQGTAWEQGANIVGDKPPGERSDLPPSGEELLRVEDDDASRLERLGNKMYEEFGDIADVAEKASNRAQELFDYRPPAGHPEVRIPTQPYVAPTAEQHETPDAGNIAQLGLVLGVIGFRTYQSLRRKLNERKGG